MAHPELSTAAIYPLRFRPIYKDYLWGGRRFEHLFHRNLPEGVVAESWEITDHPNGESMIANGSLCGFTLHQVLEARRADLLGTEGAESSDGTMERFPLMLKYLDARAALSIQVHPSTAICERLGTGDFGKTEAWVVVDAVPGSRYFAGFKQRYSREEVAAAVERGSLAEMMNPVEARVGDCILLKPGTVHALGEGVMVANIQTTSDATFRLFDWNRVDASGNPRPLHIAESLEAIDFQCGPVVPTVPRPGNRPHCEILIRCEEFHVNRWTSETPFIWDGDGRCHIWSVLEGTVTAIFTTDRHCTLTCESGRGNDPGTIEILNRGDSILVPANTHTIRWGAEEKRPVVLLDIAIP